MIIKMSACQIVENIRQRKLSVVDVAQAFINRIKEVNPIINAIHQFDPERILLEAKQKDAEIAAGGKLGKLHWLPISLKDGFSRAGLPIGLQIAAKPWQDHLVLALAKKAQELFGIPDIVNPKT